MVLIRNQELVVIVTQTQQCFAEHALFLFQQLYFLTLLYDLIFSQSVMLF